MCPGAESTLAVVQERQRIEQDKILYCKDRLHIWNSARYENVLYHTLCSDLKISRIRLAMFSERSRSKELMLSHLFT